MSTIQTKPKFEFACGTGTLRAKVGAQLTRMMFGRVALPHHGQCYVDGIVPHGSERMVLDVKRASDRAVIATLQLPCGEDTERFGVVKEAKRGGKKWKVRAQLRTSVDPETGAEQYYLALRLPEVKIAAGARAFG